MDIPKTCWNCHCGPMIPDALGAYCHHCGATWSPPVKLGAEVLERHRSWTDGQMIGSPGPGAVAHQAAEKAKAGRLDREE